MTVALVDRTRARPPARSPRRLPRLHPAEGQLTLDEVISSAWAGLSVGVPVACPVCGGRMAAGAVDAASCRACASSLD